MTFYELLDSSGLPTLPIVVPDGKKFKEYIQGILDDYYETISEKEKLFQNIRNTLITDAGKRGLSPNLANVRHSIVYEHIQILVDSIKGALNEYYKGKPSSAYQTLSIGLTRVKNFLEKQKKYSVETSFYRIRHMNGNYPLNRHELFHIPFESRELVKTQRYSIPGYPSLYLSNSIYTAWEEMGRPNENEFQAARLVNKKEIRYLDLTNDFYLSDYRNFHPDEMHFLYKAITWPLVAACSVKVHCPSNTFKPEYIIPQLVLQWINQEYIDGILYSSTHIDKSKSRSKGYFWNIVIPVKTSQQSGYCPILQDMFSMTEVSTSVIQKMATGASTYIFNNEEILNDSIEQIEIIRERPTKYIQSPLGMLELVLNSFEAKDIEFT